MQDMTGVLSMAVETVGPPTGLRQSVMDSVWHVKHHCKPVRETSNSEVPSRSFWSRFMAKGLPVAGVLELVLMVGMGSAGDQSEDGVWPVAGSTGIDFSATIADKNYNNRQYAD